MALHRTPEEHNANPPHTWHVVKVIDGVWDLRMQSDDATLERFSTKCAAELAKSEGFYVELYEKEGRWFAGESIPNWRPYAEETGQ